MKEFGVLACGRIRLAMFHNVSVVAAGMTAVPALLLFLSPSRQDFY